MIFINDTSRIQHMNRSLYLTALLLTLIQGTVSAQESAAWEKPGVAPATSAAPTSNPADRTS